MLKVLRRESGFYKGLFTLMLPIILQNLVTYSLGFLDTFMLGQTGSNEMSAVASANSAIFVLQYIIYGLTSGLGVLVAQYWGRKDMESINRCLGVVLYIGLSLSAVIALTLFSFPGKVMAVLTSNPVLIELGTPYLRWVGISYVFNVISGTYVGLQRSTENPKFGMQLYSVTMLVKTALNYILIFGTFGMPAMGITGAAMATLLSRSLEVIIVLIHATRNRRTPLIFSALLRPGREFFRKVLHYSTPVILNEGLWSAGFSTITVILGHMPNSAEMLAAYAVIGNIDQLATVSCYSIANSSAIIMGKRIGEGASEDVVYSTGKSLITTAYLCGLAVSSALAILLPTVFIPFLFPAFNLSSQAAYIATVMCIMYLLQLPLLSGNVTNMVGVLRAGGDTRMVAILDILPVWLGAVAMTALLALVLDAPIWLICLAAKSEAIFQWPFVNWRLYSRKWINDITAKKT